MSETYNPFTLKGKIIFVTGASSGIGREIAIACSKMGAEVIITGRDSQRLEETRITMGRDSVRVISTDLSKIEDLTFLVDSLPKLDGVVLAAGIVEMYPVQYATPDKFQKIFQTNFYAPIEILRLIVKKKRFNFGFSAVVIDSIAGNDDFAAGNSIYGAGKAALKSFLKFFSLEMAGKAIRVNTVSPGLILTPLQTQGAVSEEDLNKVIEKVPMKRWGMPADIAPAVIFLLSAASSYMTASDIKIDGGYTI